ncbi:MAG: MarR family transcriptional regulator [Planctomycetaceae bacterium]|nr:MarR family transcriptional regulator [Planctomycetales bacterium]MCB9923395.1 MarR family transcriptional regulator [Planctomycetaceae bacterium]
MSQLSNNKVDDLIADDVLRAIRRILRKTAEHSRQLASEGDLSVPQLLCLRKVGESTKVEPVTVADVAAAVQLSIATVSRILDRLEKGELIVRERANVDRRKVFLWLTAKGKRRIKKLPQPLHEQFLTRLRELTKAEQRNLLASLEQVVQMMGAEELDAAPVLMPGADAKSPSS